MRKLFVLALVLAATSSSLAAPAPAVPPELLANLSWRSIGPYRGGRVLAVAGVPGDPSTYYFGGAAGGVWKSTNAGASWTPTFDDQDIASIGAIAVAPSDANVVYVGTGEACIRGNISYGDGMYRSADAGRTWQAIGLRDTRHIGRVVVDPRDPQRVFVAALGHAYGGNAERGVFRTTDGGAHWTKVLFRDNDTGAIDVQLDPSNSNTVYAALWQVRRSPWNLSSGGPGSGLYKSSDGGTTWRRLSGGGLPSGIYGRIGIAVSPADPNRVYASIEAGDGGLYRSDDAGATWTRINADDRFRQRAWYFSHIFADPRAIDTVYVLNTGAFRSTDGGKTFELMPVKHGDNHGLWIDPTDPRRMIAGNDGGATLTVDGGKTWTAQNNQPTAQFYHAITDDAFPYRVYGTQQDNSGVAIQTYGDDGVISEREWYEVGGEAGYMAPDPRDANIVFTDSEHTIVRFDHAAMQGQDISITPEDESGRAAAVLQHRFAWTTPLIAPNTEPGVLYAGGEAVWRSSDDGVSWAQISGDLTRNDKSKQQPSGGPIQLDITSVEYYDTVSALAASPLGNARGTLWVGTDDGLVWVTKDTGGHWRKVTPPGLPAWGTVAAIDPSPHDAAAAYVAVDRHRLDDFHAYAWRTRDLGATWTPIAGDLPEGAFVHAVREDPARAGLLYAATELGVFVSFDDGARWQRLQNHLPVTPVTDLVVHGDDVVISTNGRGFWVLDHVDSLRELAGDARGIRRRDAHLFGPGRALRLYYNQTPDKRRPVGDNPPQGAVLDYWLASVPAGDIAIEIRDASGALVRRLSSAAPARGPDQPPEWVDQVRTPDQLPKHAGANRFVWDLRWSEPTQIPGAFYEGLPPTGPMALPGRYTVRLVAGTTVETATLDLVNDPRSKASDADLKASFDLQMKTRAVIDELHFTVNQIRSTRAQLDAVRPRADKPLVAALDAVARDMAAIEEKLVQVKLASSEGNLRFPSMLNEQLDVFRSVIESDHPPTKAELELYAHYAGDVDGAATAWQGIVANALPALNQRIATSSVVVIDPNAPLPASTAHPAEPARPQPVEPAHPVEPSHPPRERLHERIDVPAGNGILCPNGHAPDEYAHGCPS